MKIIVTVIKYIFVLLLCIKNVESKLTSPETTNAENEEIFHRDLLQKFQQQKAFTAILMVNKGNKYSYCNYMLQWLKSYETPVTVITVNETFKYSNYFNKEIMVIACSSLDYEYHKILEQLAEILDNIRSTRIVIIMDAYSLLNNLQLLKDFFKHCQKLKMLNVVVISKNFYKKHRYVQYTIFPKFQLEFGVYQPNSKYFQMLPDRLKDLKGYKLRTIVDHIEPRAMEYYDENNKTVLVGYLGRFLQAVTMALNATLYFPVKIPFNGILSFDSIEDYFKYYSLDIPVTAFSIFEKFDEFSYPIEFGKWCLLLPMEKRIETKDIYLMILHSQVMCIAVVLILIFSLVLGIVFLSNRNARRSTYHWPEILINDIAIRGVLGASFEFTAFPRLSFKQIFLMLLLSGSTISIIFDSFLQSFSTSPPFEPEIQNYQQLLASDLEVAVTKRFFELFHNLTNSSASFLYKKFKVLSSFEEFSNLRDTFDQHYAYPTFTAKMLYYDALEVYYHHKIFRFSSKMCPNTMVQFHIPLGKNSHFRNRLHELTLNTWESGLLNYWRQRKSFEDVLATGKAIKMNFPHSKEQKPLAVQDLYWIWFYYMVFTSVAILVFILELIIHKKMQK